MTELSLLGLYKESTRHCERSEANQNIYFNGLLRAFALAMTDTTERDNSE